ncbi:uncharacterized protein LOC122033474 [Zingiber officinale]|uniref:Uncharacterized protein n=1 Tax=Zingiber officinale TaxID=94328 RepID=A0A8J5IBI5_ZINOF|nr:uncharacterized protein LOC122033474 [Zingiber officinale]KAG6537340.1 hypothetical protein ZIOFF_002429 [Zingiber officinale]
MAAAVESFHFDGRACSSPYVSAPSSPERGARMAFDLFYHYNSAPTSPTRAASAVNSHFAGDALPPLSSALSSGVPFDWEEKPGTPKSRGSPNNDDHGGFAFDFGGRCGVGQQGSLADADELFEEGMIRPLKPPPRLQYPAEVGSVASSPRSPKPITRGLWSPRGRSDDFQFDPFTAAMVETTRESSGTWRKDPTATSFSRLRSLLKAASNSSVSEAATASPRLPNPSATGSDGGSKRSRLRDLLLLRSESEGRAAGNKYTLLSSDEKMAAGDAKNASFRSTDGRRVKSSEELRKKTAWPYRHRHSIFGCLRFNSAVLTLKANLCRRR